MARSMPLASCLETSSGPLIDRPVSPRVLPMTLTAMRSRRQRADSIHVVLQLPIDRKLMLEREAEVSSNLVPVMEISSR